VIWTKVQVDLLEQDGPVLIQQASNAVWYCHNESKEDPGVLMDFHFENNPQAASYHFEPRDAYSSLWILRQPSPSLFLWRFGNTYSYDYCSLTMSMKGGIKIL
jgi:hypothetical protein